MEVLYDDDCDDVLEFLYNSNDEYEEQRGGWRPDKSANLDRNRANGALQFCKDYLPLHRRTQIRSVLGEFVFRINFSFMSAINIEEKRNHAIFNGKKNSTDLGLGKNWKCAVAMRTVADKTSGETVDEIFRTSRSTAKKYVEELVRTIILSYKIEFLRSSITFKQVILLQC